MVSEGCCEYIISRRQKESKNEFIIAKKETGILSRMEIIEETKTNQKEEQGERFVNVYRYKVSEHVSTLLSTVHLPPDGTKTAR